MADEPDLRPGDTGAYVTYLKQLLNYRDPASQLDDTNDQWPDVRGSELGDVLWRFQSSRGLPNIGYCDRAHMGRPPRRG
jgi:murein L,D-transpeptidase YcbB/YkuD